MDMLDDENLEYFSNNHFKKRKEKKNNFEDDLKFENSYKPKANFNKENNQLKNRKKLLPIKGETGVIEQYLEIEDKNNIEIKKKDAPKQEEAIIHKKKPETEDKKPKTMVEVLLQKKLMLENTKEKIGLLCRSIIENPQGEVC